MTTLNRGVEPSEISDGKPHPGRRMTEEEFVAWCDEDTKAEWVDGDVIVMAPVSDAHSNLNGWLLALIRLFVENHDLGEVRGSEFQARFGNLRRRRVPDV